MSKGFCMFAKLRNLLRFDLATLICFVMALNFMVFVNWQTRHAYFVEFELSRRNHILYRPTYDVGWPAPFLQLNGIKERKVTNTLADRIPLVEVISWKNAAWTVAVNVLIAVFITAMLGWLRKQFLVKPTVRGRGTSAAPTP
jgi:hypothetical protein